MGLSQPAHGCGAAQSISRGSRLCTKLPWGGPSLTLILSLIVRGSFGFWNLDESQSFEFKYSVNQMWLAELFFSFTSGFTDISVVGIESIRAEVIQTSPLDRKIVLFSFYSEGNENTGILYSLPNITERLPLIKNQIAHLLIL